MANILTAIISADGQQFTKTMSDLIAQQKRFEDALKNTTGIESIARLNRAIDATKQRIEALRSFSGLDKLNNQFSTLSRSSNAANVALINTGRIFQDLPFGIIGVANNINPLLESFQRLRQESGSTGGAMKSLVASLSGGGGLGFAFSLVTAALSFLTIGFSAFTRGLSGNKSAVDEDKAALDRLNLTIDDTKKRLDGLSESINFINKLASINIRIFGQSELLNLQGQSVANMQKIVDLEKEEAEALKLSQDARRLDLDDPEKQAEAEKNALDNLRRVQSELTKTRQEQVIIERTIALQRVEDQKKAQDESLAALKEFVNKAKEIQSRFPALVPEKIDDLFDNFSTQVKKAKVIISDFELGFPAKINAGAQQTEVPEITIPTAVIKVLSPEFELGKPVLHKLLFGEKTPEQIARELKDKIESNLRAIGNVIQNTIAPAFESFVESIFNGGDALKSFFQSLVKSVEQLIGKLVAAAAVAAIISAISGGVGAPGGVSFLGAFKQILGFRAGGGPVTGGGSYIVGERGPEIFTPNTSGMIIPNGSFGAVNPGNMLVEVSGILRADGDGLVAVISRTMRQQKTR